LQELGRATDAGQRIFDLMRESSGDNAKMGQAIFALDFFGQFFLIAQIMENEDKPEKTE
jgi:hypothetical protein